MGEKTLLAIDDDPAFREFLREFLKETDYRAVVTENAAEFRLAYAEQEPAAVILDIVMPDTDGFELVQWLTTEGYRSRIILVTGFSARYVKMAESLATAHGQADVITLEKPVAIAKLRAALDIAGPRP